jgi:hypothetical protein
VPHLKVFWRAEIEQERKAKNLASKRRLASGASAKFLVLGMQRGSEPSEAELPLAARRHKGYSTCVKIAEVKLTDAVYQQMEETAARLHLSVPDLLRSLAEQAIQHDLKSGAGGAGNWRFPEGRHLGAFRAPVEDWRLLANESAD